LLLLSQSDCGVSRPGVHGKAQGVDHGGAQILISPAILLNSHGCHCPLLVIDKLRWPVCAPRTPVPPGFFGGRGGGIGKNDAPGNPLLLIGPGSRCRLQAPIASRRAAACIRRNACRGECRTAATCDSRVVNMETRLLSAGRHARFFESAAQPRGVQPRDLGAGPDHRHGGKGRPGWVCVGSPLPRPIQPGAMSPIAGATYQNKSSSASAAATT